MALQEDIEESRLDKATLNGLDGAAELIIASVDPAYLWAGGEDALPRNNQLCVFDQRSAPLFCTRPADGAAIVLFGDQRPIPSNQGVRRHQSPNLKESASADHLGPGSEAPSLSIGEQQTLSTELLA